MNTKTHTPNVYVKDMGGRIVKTIPCPMPMSEGQQEQLLMGLLRNMNTDSYFVDDSEIDEARAALSRAKGAE